MGGAIAGKPDYLNMIFYIYIHTYIMQAIKFNTVNDSRLASTLASKYDSPPRRETPKQQQMISTTCPLPSMQQRVLGIVISIKESFTKMCRNTYVLLEALVDLC